MYMHSQGILIKCLQLKKIGTREDEQEKFVLTFLTFCPTYHHDCYYTNSKCELVTGMTYNVPPITYPQGIL